jgi:hypothetical protein
MGTLIAPLSNPRPLSKRPLPFCRWSRKLVNSIAQDTAFGMAPLHAHGEDVRRTKLLSTSGL